MEIHWKEATANMKVTFGPSSHQVRNIRPCRAPTAWESRIMERLLSRPFPGRDELLHHVRAACVSAYCTHCPSIWLDAEYKRSSDSIVLEDGRLLLGIAPYELYGPDADGVPISILLRVAQGFVHELEVFRADGKPFLSLPEVDMFELLSNEQFRARFSRTW